MITELNVGYLVPVSLLKFSLQIIHSSLMQILRINRGIKFSEIKINSMKISNIYTEYYIQMPLVSCFKFTTFHSNHTFFIRQLIYIFKMGYSRVTSELLIND